MKVNEFDGVVTIIPASKYGANHDIASVELMFQTDAPIPAKEKLLVPARPVPLRFRKVFEEVGLRYEPRFRKYFVKEVGDIPEDALKHHTEEVFIDAIEAMRVSLMYEATLTPLIGTNNVYHLSYEVPVYRNREENFVFTITGPFKGMQVNSGGGSVELVVVLPDTAIVDEHHTRGIIENGGEWEEQIKSIPNNKRKVISFFYQKNPHFEIHYDY